MKLLITGGTGYIGSHSVIEILTAGYEIIIVDNLSNSSVEVLDRIASITGNKPIFIEANICDKKAMQAVFDVHDIQAVIHFAGLKSVGESSVLPLSYYSNNVSGTAVLLEVMKEYNVKNMVFSSSATVYGENNISPLVESMKTSATNPYGRTKLIIEEMLFDLAISDPEWSIISLRYFNPIGAHASGLIGENPSGIPNNLLPYVAQVAIGRLERLQVFGDDYDTADGTGIRDYIHVVDLAIAHLKALQYLQTIHGHRAINIGTGNGTSVLEIINKFAYVSKQKIPYNVVPRRLGDIASVYADASLAKKVLGWQAERDLHSMIEDTWRWQLKNPNGY